MFFCFFESKKKFFKILLILLLSFKLAGCALLNTIIQLAPLAAVLVYHSAPTEMEDGNILCFKTVRTYEEAVSEGRSYAQNIKNEYYICLIEPETGKTKELTQILDDKFYELDEGLIEHRENKDKITFALDNPKGTWQLNIDGSDLKKISNKAILLKDNRSSKNCYAFLPCPEIKDLLSY